MVGELILGRFRVEAAIGSGGFGTVYRAWDERLERPVAVKVIDSADAAPRVMREAQAVARLGHRNIATLYELAGENGRAYLVSELIEGETLRALARRGELSDRLVAEVGVDSAAALAHAHRGGVVHRDVKPENVMVGPGGESKLVDFGIARISGERTLTGTGDVLGTLAYMAPEQADGQRPGPAADVYSLALTLYECLCGEHPLIREGAAATARAIGEPIAPLSLVRPDLPEPVTAAIDSALDADPELRPLASELEGVLSAHVDELDGAPLPPVLRPSEESEPRRRGFSPPQLNRLAPAAAIGSLALVALLVAGAAVPAVVLTVPLAAAVAVVRPRLGIALAAAGTLASLALASPSEPGAALAVAILALPLIAIPAGAGAATALPGLAPILGLAGAGAAYPALAGLTRTAPARLLTGAMGYIWLAAWEIATGKTLLLGPETAAPAAWSESISAGLGDVLVPLLDPRVLLGAAVWALAAAVLPVLIRGRAPLMDFIGALVWAAGLISAQRLASGPEGEPAGLLAAALVAACVAAFAAPRLRQASQAPGVSIAAEPGTGVRP